MNKKIWKNRNNSSYGNVFKWAIATNRTEQVRITATIFARTTFLRFAPFIEGGWTKREKNHETKTNRVFVENDWSPLFVPCLFLGCGFSAQFWKICQNYASVGGRWQLWRVINFYRILFSSSLLFIYSEIWWLFPFFVDAFCYAKDLCDIYFFDRCIEIELFIVTEIVLYYFRIKSDSRQITKHYYHRKTKYFQTFWGLTIQNSIWAISEIHQHRRLILKRIY